MAAAPPRPPAVTTASLFLGACCVLLLANVVVLLNGWNSIDVQDGLRKALTPSVLNDSGLTFDQAAVWARRLLLGSIALLVAGVVFAVYTALGHQASRILLTVLAAFASVAFLASGGILGMIPAVLAIACGFQLWTPQARTWFAVKNGRPAPVAPAPSPAVAPPADHQLQHQQAPQVQHPYPYGPPVRRSDPARVIALTVLIGASIVGAGSAAYLLIYGFARDALVQQELDSGVNWMDLSEREIRESLQTLAFLSGAALPISVVAIVVSAVLLRRRRRP